jgi:hypothetical protein
VILDFGAGHLEQALFPVLVFVDSRIIHVLRLRNKE